MKFPVREYGRPASFRPIHTELFLGGLRSVVLVTCRASVCAVSQDALTIRRTLILSVVKPACVRAAVEHKIYFNIPIYKRRRGLIPLLRRPEREADDAPSPSIKTRQDMSWLKRFVAGLLKWTTFLFRKGHCGYDNE